MRDVHNIIITANGGELPKTSSDMGKSATQDVPIRPVIANIGDVK